MTSTTTGPFTVSLGVATRDAFGQALRDVGRDDPRIVVVDGRKPREGQYLETIGQYAPRGGNQALNLVTDRANYWLDKGAQPSD